MPARADPLARPPRRAPPPPDPAELRAAVKGLLAETMAAFAPDADGIPGGFTTSSLNLANVPVGQVGAGAGAEVHGLYALGRSRVFLRAEALAALQDALATAHATCATKLQAFARGKVLRNRRAAQSRAVVRLQAAGRRMLVCAGARQERRRAAAATVIQAGARRAAAVREWTANRAVRRLALQRTRAVTALQSAARGKRARAAARLAREEAKSVAGLKAKLDRMQAALETERARAEAEDVRAFVEML